MKFGLALCFATLVAVAFATRRDYGIDCETHDECFAEDEKTPYCVFTETGNKTRCVECLSASDCKAGEFCAEQDVEETGEEKMESFLAYQCVEFGPRVGKTCDDRVGDSITVARNTSYSLYCGYVPVWDEETEFPTETAWVGSCIDAVCHECRVGSSSTNNWAARSGSGNRAFCQYPIGGASRGGAYSAYNWNTFDGVKQIFIYSQNLQNWFSIVVIAAILALNCMMVPLSRRSNEISPANSQFEDDYGSKVGQ